MKHKLPFIISISCLFIYKLLQYVTKDSFIALSIFIVPISMLIMNMVIRKRLIFKSWFLSKYNIFLEKEISIFESEISKELLYEKMIEVVKMSPFKVMDVEANTFELLIGTAPNFWTWGENLYIEIKEKGNENTEIKIIAVTVFGSYSWNRNRKNSQQFYESFQESLTI